MLSLHRTARQSTACPTAPRPCTFAFPPKRPVSFSHGSCLATHPRALPNSATTARLPRATSRLALARPTLSTVDSVPVGTRWFFVLIFSLRCAPNSSRGFWSCRCRVVDRPAHWQQRSLIPTATTTFFHHKHQKLSHHPPPCHRRPLHRRAKSTESRQCSTRLATGQCRPPRHRARRFTLSDHSPEAARVRAIATTSTSSDRCSRTSTRP